MVDTATHGGIHLDDWRQAQVPESVRRPDAWYEHDCQWSIPAVLFSDELDPRAINVNDVREQATVILSSWAPKKYQIVMEARKAARPS